MSLSPQQVKKGRTNHQIGTRRIMENEKMSIWHISLIPGQTIPAHRHDRPYFWTALTDGTGLSRFATGPDVHMIYQIGDTKYFPDLTPKTGFVHDLTNTGETDLMFITVEFNPTE